MCYCIFKIRTQKKYCETRNNCLNQFLGFTATGTRSDQPLHGQLATALQGERRGPIVGQVWSGGVHEDPARYPRTQQRGWLRENGV